MNEEAAETLALEALAWIASDEARLIGFLRITGLTPEGLRGKAGDRSTLIAVIDFLMGRESDLLDCCQDLEMDPAQPARARMALAGRPERDFG